MKHHVFYSVRCLFSVAASAVWFTAAWGADYSAQPLAEGPPTDELAPEIAKKISAEGVKVKRGANRTLCDIWLSKEVSVKNFKPGLNLLYPFQPGQLMGVVRFARRGGDFRDQQISKGVYTIRYAQQPVDGAHVGTSITRDFLLLIEAGKDKSPKTMDYKTLTMLSSEAAQSAHPALLSLQPVVGDEKMRHNEEHDWWIVRLTASAKAEKATKKVPLDLVVVGAAVE